MIDLNADLGEGMGEDAAMLEIVTSASIACGGHAGDPGTMRGTVRAALANGVRIGAHPGFADPEHFGRRRLDIPLAAIIETVLGQVAALDTIVTDEGGRIAYLKLHGALANMAAEDEALARAIFAAMAEKHGEIAILALAASAQERAARHLGLPVIAEAYADRAYTADGLLAPRGLAGSVIADRETVVARCLRIARDGEIETVEGRVIRSNARSICLHGDTPGALGLARSVHAALAGAGLIGPRAAPD